MAGLKLHMITKKKKSEKNFKNPGTNNSKSGGHLILTNTQLICTRKPDKLRYDVWKKADALSHPYEKCKKFRINSKLLVKPLLK